MTALPAGLRDRVLASARQARSAGSALPPLPALLPADAFTRAADAFLGLLRALPDDAWRRPVLRDLDVQGLVGHLLGVERDVQRALAGDPDVAGADHVASTHAVAAQQAGRTPSETADDWRAAIGLSLATARSVPPDAVVAVHGMRLPLGALLVVRAFELWTHENDIRRVAGLPPSTPDAATLRLMTGLAVQLLPHGVSLVSERTAPVDVHLVLTGAGGGTWDVVLGERDGTTSPDVAIVADAVAFCRLVANRIGPVELDAHVSGAEEHAAAVLAGAAALALD